MIILQIVSHSLNHTHGRKAWSIFSSLYKIEIFFLLCQSRWAVGVWVGGLSDTLVRKFPPLVELLEKGVGEISLEKVTGGSIIPREKLRPENINFPFCHHIPFWPLAEESQLHPLQHSWAETGYSVLREVCWSYRLWHIMGTKTQFVWQVLASCLGPTRTIRAPTRTIPYLEWCDSSGSGKRFLAEYPRALYPYIHQYPGF